MNSLAEMRRITDSPKRDPLGTFLTPVDTNVHKLAVRAVYFESPIDLGALQARYPHSQVLTPTLWCCVCRLMPTWSCFASERWSSGNATAYSPPMFWSRSSMS